MIPEVCIYTTYDSLVHDSINFSRSNFGFSGSVITVVNIAPR